MVTFFFCILAFFATRDNLIARFASIVVIDVDYVWALAMWPSIFHLLPWGSALPTAATGVKCGYILLAFSAFTITAKVAEFEGTRAFDACLIDLYSLEEIFL